LSWLTDKLRAEISSIFNPRYGRKLTPLEIDEIAESLTLFTETMTGGDSDG
jgi:hypothetical protein